LTDELLKAYQFQLKSASLVPSVGGVFELKVDDQLVYSKKATKRHPAPGEVRRLLEAVIGPPKPRD
jgi:selenoprotein W-related protein